LGLAVARRYRASFGRALADIDRNEPSPAKRLDRYADLFAESLSNGRICLCGLLAADGRNVPDPIRTEVGAFFEEQTAWLQHTLRTLGLKPAVAVRRAEALLAGLEGALIIASSRRMNASFGSTAKELVRAATARV
jgi:TetR/AcrR family transcriptional regulator, transcriptional repressor for nem operon